MKTYPQGLTRFAATVGVLFSLGAVAPANAYFATFDDRDEFTSVASNLTNVDFEGYAPEHSYRYYGSTPLTEGNVQFSGSDNYMYIVDDDYYPVYFDWGSDAVLFGYLGGTITATFSEGVNAVGSDFMALVQTANGLTKASADFDVTLSDGSTYSVTSMDYPDRAFFGVVSDEFDIASIAFTAEANAFITLDNFIHGDFQASADVPIPGLPFLMLPGLVWLLRREASRA